MFKTRKVSVYAKNELIWSNFIFEENFPCSQFSTKPFNFFFLFVVNNDIKYCTLVMTSGKKNVLPNIREKQS